MLEGQDGLAEEGEHQGEVDLQGELQDELQDGPQGDPQDDLLQVGAVRAAPKGSLQQKYVSCRIYDGATGICVFIGPLKTLFVQAKLGIQLILTDTFLERRT